MQHAVTRTEAHVLTGMSHIQAEKLLLVGSRGVLNGLVTLLMDTCNAKLENKTARMM